MEWTLAPGDEVARTDIEALYGGSRQRGISAPRRGSRDKNIKLWWRPERGELFGYSDGWLADGSAFYFSGMGQNGDQVFGGRTPENGRLRDHMANGDRIRLLKYLGKNHTRYIGELRLDPGEPWTWRTGPDRAGLRRKFIRFRLLPVGEVRLGPEDVVQWSVPDAGSTDATLPSLPPDPGRTALERLHTVSFRRLLGVQDLIAERREATLVHDFAAWLRRTRSLELRGYQIEYRPEGRPLRADAYLERSWHGETPGVLFEAKSSSSRESIRMAIGQVLDYVRYVEPEPVPAILLPTPAPVDMIPLLGSLGIGLAWREDGDFHLHGLSIG